MCKIIENYAEYTSIGGTADESAFTRWATRADSVINGATFGRLDCFSEIPIEAKYAARDLIEFFYEKAKKEWSGVASKSQTAGAVSESVSFSQKTEEENKAAVDDIIYGYLFAVKKDGLSILYRGADF